mgnify:CR=1 FL=1
MLKCLHIYFSGRVQGVGFRFTANHLAKRHALSGWVMNLPDGRVELLIQGEKENIDNFLADLNKEFKGYIMNTEIEELPLKDDLKDFHIRFY